MGKTAFVALLTAGICVLACGCTYQSWYAGLQERQRQECMKLAGSNDVQNCLDTTNSRTYDQYKAEREEAGKASR